MHLETRVFVTGGAGFLGSHLCERLLVDGAVVLCVDNFFTGARRNIEHLIESSSIRTDQARRHFPALCRSRSRSTIWPVPLRPFTTNMIRCKRQKRACMAQSTCWDLRNACGQKFFRRPRRKSMATPASILSRKIIGVTSTRSAHAPATMKPSAAPRPCFLTIGDSTIADQGCQDLQYLWPAHAPERRAGGIEFHRTGAARP